MSCAKCPCPDVCLAWPLFCGWAAEDRPDPVQLRHICARSALAAGQDPPPSDYPSLAAQAGNALGAAGRVVATAVRGAAVVVDRAEQERRLSICHACEHYDHEQGRCRICACIAAWKAKLATEHCPLPTPRW